MNDVFFIRFQGKEGLEQKERERRREKEREREKRRKNLKSAPFRFRNPYIMDTIKAMILEWTGTFIAKDPNTRRQVLVNGDGTKHYSNDVFAYYVAGFK